MDIIAKPKHVIASKAVWGGIIGLVSAAAPIISALSGIDINADDINRGVSHVSEVTQAVGGLVGFGMVLWSRLQKRFQPATMGSTAKNVELTVPNAVATTSPATTARTAPATTASTRRSTVVDRDR